MDDLPPQQAAVLNFVRNYQAKEGVSPAIHEIAGHFGFSNANAAKLLTKLSTRGAISREPGARRSIRLASRAATRSMQLPLIGRIAAGKPITCGEHVAEYIDVSPTLFSPRADLLFRVSGESMINAGICDGDLVGIHLQDINHNGQIVAAVIHHPVTGDLEMTLKTMRRRGSAIALVAENDDQQRFAPMTFKIGKDAIQIIGTYCGLIRPKPQVNR